MTTLGPKMVNGISLHAGWLVDKLPPVMSALAETAQQ